MTNLTHQGGREIKANTYRHQERHPDSDLADPTRNTRPTYLKVGVKLLVDNAHWRETEREVH